MPSVIEKYKLRGTWSDLKIPAVACWKSAVIEIARSEDANIMARGLSNYVAFIDFQSSTFKVWVIGSDGRIKPSVEHLSAEKS